MNRLIPRASVWLMAALCLMAAARVARGQVPAADALHGKTYILSLEGKAEVARKGGNQWSPATERLTLEPGDRLRTAEGSRALVRLPNLIIFRLNQVTEIQIVAPPEGDSKPRLSVLGGAAYLFSRARPPKVSLEAPSATGATRGTEVHVEVAGNGRTVFTVLEGEMEVSDPQQSLTLLAGQQAAAGPGEPLNRKAMVSTMNVIQWCLYYPGVLDVDELGLGAAEQAALAASLTAYRAGDLVGALGAYPAGRPAGAAAEQVYHAGLLLSVGQVEKAEGLLKELPADGGAGALREVIAAVRHEPTEPLAAAESAAEWLARSYFAQSRARLEEALAAARKAVERSPRFGFAWARVAELEFGFGRRQAAAAALNTAMELSPRDAQAWALRGFLCTADHQLAEAVHCLEHAMELDGALANAWLGRGLCRICQGHTEAGLEDLQTAAALEPNRAVLRSYLAKAFSQRGHLERSEKELALAREADPFDPTAWLYAALLDHQRNRLNLAVDELEHSKELNENRGLFRSRLMLDQDQAVRGANLAALYRDAGLTEVSVREAARAVSYDYANASAHLFLAGSYDALRDPRQVSLRYETPWFNELLLANLLLPVGAGALSQTVSQQEYSRLFSRDGLGLSAGTEYLSRGDWRSYASQYGVSGGSAYALDAVYARLHGQRPNEDLDQLTFYAKIKQQLTPQDTVFFETIYYGNDSGDVRQYYDPAYASPTLRFREKQEPDFFAGYHHEWGPGSHTLFLFGRLDDRVSLTEPLSRYIVFRRNADHSIGRVVRDDLSDFDLQGYHSSLEAYSAEAQQIWQSPVHTLVVGARFQRGEAQTDARIFRDPGSLPAALLGADGLREEASRNTLERTSIYFYEQAHLTDSLLALAGVSYDQLLFPANIDLPPLSADDRGRGGLSPKAGLIWTVATNTYVRGAYTRSLGGIYYDTSVRLEPTQVAGFVQAFRSLMPESEVGQVPGARFETWGVALDHRFRTRTYVTLGGELLRSRGDRFRGAFEFATPPAASANLHEDLSYQEKTTSLTLNQLVGESWSFGATYRLSEADLEDRLPEVPETLYALPTRDVSSVLHQVTLQALFNHRSGFFARGESVWFAQSNRGFASGLTGHAFPDRPGDEFWQFNLLFGYRLPNRRAELTLGILNLADRDYLLSPLNLHAELARSRTILAQLRFNL